VNIRQRGFTLIELLVVLALVAVATGLVSLAIRDPNATALEQEAARLAALLESARAESRASGVLVRWEPRTSDNSGEFRFTGLPAATEMPNKWLSAGVSAQVQGAGAVVLGPEPLIGAQRITLKLEDRQLTLATDGLGPFEVQSE
jgi:general secretion pathway protein H